MPGNRNFYLLFALAAAISAVPSPAFAKDELESIIRKDKLTAGDVATIETVVNQRVKKFNDAINNVKQLREIRNSLVATSKIPKASPAALNVYAEACASALMISVTHDKLAVGLESVQVLAELQSIETVDALSTALRSPHEAVRYRAAVALRGLHPTFASDRTAAKSAITSLGRAGASETNELVLRAIYEAIDVKQQVANFEGGDDSASALIEIFSSRLSQLAAGSRDEWKDIAGFEAAARCFADAAAGRKRDLVVYLYGILELHEKRYSAEDTSPEYIPTLASATRSLEQTLTEALRVGNAKAPGSLAAKMSARRTAATRKATQDAVAEWKAAFQQTPWPLQ